ncbi:MAG TPA: Dna2/Cas4 domain-containing protein, partial [Paludibacter sp.]|nr:Dna2/Cas4 domain-containing protein [Paludibacter sp.]
MLTTGTHFNYYLICQRKLWLFANGIQMETTSDLVYEGKLLHETSYPHRAEKYQ